RADDMLLVPQRNEDGEATGALGWRQTFQCGQRDPQDVPLDPDADPDQIDEKVAGAKDKEADAGEQRQFTDSKSRCVEQISPVHRFPPIRTGKTTISGGSC